MKTFKIDKNIPIPKKDRYKKSHYPFSEMQISDSFPVNKANNILAARSHASHFTNRIGWKFIVRKDNMEYRLWRIA